MAGVERAGEIYVGPVYFPLAVLVLFGLARSNVLLYLVPLLVLTFADAAGALVGVRYGTLKYEATGGRKSVEGSTAFFLAAFFSAHVPLLLASDLGRAETLLIGLTFGLLLTMVEAVAWAGLDNLFLPLVGYLLLKTYVGLGVEPLVGRLAVTALLAGIAWLARGRAWNDAGLILAILVGYTCANLGGPEWLLVTILMFVGVAWLSPGREHAPVRTVREVGAVSAVGVIWVGVAHELRRPELLAAFSGSFAAHLAMIGIARPRGLPLVRRLLLPAAFGVLWILAPYVLIERGAPSAWTGAGGAAVGSAVAALLFALALSGRQRRFADAGRWWLQAVLAAVASLGGLAVYLVPD
jgi:phytol kinase